MRLFLVSNGKVIRLDISVDDSSGMDILHSLEHLQSTHQSCLETEFLFAHLKQAFQRGTKEIHDHDVLTSMCAIELDLWDGLCDNRSL